MWTGRNAIDVPAFLPVTSAHEVPSFFPFLRDFCRTCITKGDEGDLAPPKKVLETLKVKKKKKISKTAEGWVKCQGGKLL